MDIKVYRDALVMGRDLRFRFTNRKRPDLDDKGYQEYEPEKYLPRRGLLFVDGTLTAMQMREKMQNLLDQMGRVSVEEGYYMAVTLQVLAHIYAEMDDDDSVEILYH